MQLQICFFTKVGGRNRVAPRQLSIFSLTCVDFSLGVSLLFLFVFFLVAQNPAQCSHKVAFYL